MDFPSSSAASGFAPSSPLARGSLSRGGGGGAQGAPGASAPLNGSELGSTNGAPVDNEVEEETPAGGESRNADATIRRQGRPKNPLNAEDVPPVQDETGERVREGFAEFLEK